MKVCTLEYMDGKEEVLPNRVVYYEGDEHTSNFYGTGVGDVNGFLAISLRDQRPIVIAREVGKPEAERIINPNNVRSIRFAEA